VTGVGFLCAGVIMHQGATVRGINTAATVWCAAAVGVLAGFGQLWWAGLVTAIIVLANFVLHFIEHRLLKSQQAHTPVDGGPPNQ
jgi:putative Mg2+ transporter-C (MgtC) family protein